MGAVRHRFTVEEYRKMGEAGIFHEDDRVELIGGEVVWMAAMGGKHVESVMRLTSLLSRWTFSEAARTFGDGHEGAVFFVGVQNTVVLGESDMPQPDLTLVRRVGDRFGVPSPEDALLVVEVADTSSRYDRDVRLPAYAAAGIPEAWMVDLNAETVQVCSEPGSEGYGKVVGFGRGQRVVSATVSGLAFDTADALPPEG